MRPGLCALDEALSDYERKRNEAVMPMYEMTCRLAALQAPPPEMQAIFWALRSNQHQTNHFFGLMAGSVPIAKFYSTRNIELIMNENILETQAA